MQQTRTTETVQNVALWEKQNFPKKTAAEQGDKERDKQTGYHTIARSFSTNKARHSSCLWQKNKLKWRWRPIELQPCAFLKLFAFMHVINQMNG